MMKMHDQGTMPKEMDNPPSVTEGKKEKHYPTTYFSSKKLPGIEGYDIGDECKICSVNKVIGKREKDDGEIEIEVEILQSGIMGKNTVDKKEYDKMSSEEKDEEDEKEVMEEDE